MAKTGEALNTLDSFSNQRHSTSNSSVRVSAPLEMGCMKCCWQTTVNWASASLPFLHPENRSVQDYFCNNASIGSKNLTGF